MSANKAAERRALAGRLSIVIKGARDVEDVPAKYTGEPRAAQAYKAGAYKARLDGLIEAAAAYLEATDPRPKKDRT